jgi:UDP-N-acetylmuramate dehydrogenase
MNWYSGLEDICRPDVPLSEHTWYGLGGPARWLLTPRDEDQLAEILRRCARHGIGWRILGRGANVLVRDDGVDGAVIKLIGSHWESFTVDTPRVRAAAGVDFPRLVQHTVNAGLAGLENLAGIPGTVGGIIRMNAGGRYGTISQYVHAVRLVRADGTPEVRSAAEMGFGYRTSGVGDAVVVEATFVLTPGDPQEVAARFRRIWQEKAASQPAVAARTAGCVFKNPPGHSAGALIDQAGLKGCRRGQAEISTKHANFIVAHAGATARDVLDLIALARETVARRTGITLEPEIEIW